MGVALTFLQRYPNEGNEYLNSIVIGHETNIDNCDKLAPFSGGRLL